MARAARGGRMHAVMLHDTAHRGFASDNYAGAHPEVLAALANANGGHQVAYGQDAYTARLTEVMGRHFGRYTGPRRRGCRRSSRTRTQTACLKSPTE